MHRFPVLDQTNASINLRTEKEKTHEQKAWAYRVTAFDFHVWIYRIWTEFELEHNEGLGLDARQYDGSYEGSPSTSSPQASSPSSTRHGQNEDGRKREQTVSFRSWFWRRVFEFSAQ